MAPGDSVTYWPTPANGSSYPAELVSQDESDPDLWHLLVTNTDARGRKFSCTAKVATEPTAGSFTVPD